MEDIKEPIFLNKLFKYKVGDVLVATSEYYPHLNETGIVYKLKLTATYNDTCKNWKINKAYGLIDNETGEKCGYVWDEENLIYEPITKRNLRIYEILEDL